MDDVPEVLFVCVHNAGRSQMAAALLDHHAAGRVRVRSAGSAPAATVNPAVTAALAEVGLDISREFPKPLTDRAARTADVLVTMGCGDACPVYPGKRYLDWELDDPAGRPIEAVRVIRDEIDARVRSLLRELVPDPRRSHWDDRYGATEAAAVSWFQQRPSVSLDLIAESGVAPSAAVLDVGGGAGTLVDALLDQGWSDLTVMDVSDVALGVARDRVGAGERVTWLVADLLTWRPTRRYDLWHDRAVFHFLVDEADRRRYRLLLGEALADGATVVVGTFAADGPTYCSGLPVSRYDVAGLVHALGDGLELLAARSEDHRTPAGDVQPFTWVLLRARAGR